MADIIPYNQQNPDSMSYIQVDSNAIQKAGKWIAENPGKTAMGCFGLGLLFTYLYARKANKAKAN